MPPELAEMNQISDASGSHTWGDDFSEIRKLYRKVVESARSEPELDRRLVEKILEHARQVIRHPSRPRTTESVPFVENLEGELDLEESLENDPKLKDVSDLRVEISFEKKTQCVAMLDCSSSMSGDKHLLASIAVAVMLLEVPESSSLITFASGATVIKSSQSSQTLAATLLKFLRVKPRGFTNIGKGLEFGLKQSMKKRIGLLASDGRTTEGEDPIEIARRFDSLVVLHLHGSGSDLAASQRIAQSGHGYCLEVERFEELPRRLYEALRVMVR